MRFQWALVALLVAALAALSLTSVGEAHAAPPGAPSGESPSSDDKGTKDEECGLGASVADALKGGKCNNAPVPTPGDAVDAAGDAAGAAGDAASGAASKAAEGAMDQVTDWMVGGATWMSERTVEMLTKTQTPELDSKWFARQWQPMVALGLGLAALVAALGLGSAALRRDPDALAGVFIGMFRAGLVTGVVLALTAMALGVTDAIANEVLKTGVGPEGRGYWQSVEKAWDTERDGGAFGASVVTFFFAAVQLLVGGIVWLELQLRNALIYVALLFMPVTLAASIWAPLKGWQNRLQKILGLALLLKPVIVIVMSLSGAALGAGLVGEGGYSTILSGLVILAVAAASPWMLLFIVGADSESTQALRSGGQAAASGLGRATGAIGAASTVAGPVAAVAGSAISGAGRGTAKAMGSSSSSSGAGGASRGGPSSSSTSSGSSGGGGAGGGGAAGGTGAPHLSTVGAASGRSPSGPSGGGGGARASGSKGASSSTSAGASSSGGSQSGAPAGSSSSRGGGSSNGGGGGSSSVPPARAPQRGAQPAPSARGGSTGPPPRPSSSTPPPRAPRGSNP